MNSGIAAFALGVVGIAAAAAMVAPPVAEAPAANQLAEPTMSVVTREVPPPKVPPQGYGMVSNSISPGPITVRMEPRPPNPPIVAIPRIPGPADMMLAQGFGQPLLTLRSFPSNEACEEALPAMRRRQPDAFCVSTTMPPPPPEHGYLVEVRTADNELVGLETHPSMAECERVRASRPGKQGIQSVCTPKLH